MMDTEEARGIVAAHHAATIMGHSMPMDWERKGNLWTSSCTLCVRRSVVLPDQGRGFGAALRVRCEASE